MKTSNCNSHIVLIFQLKNQGFFFNAESVRNVDSLKTFFHKFPLVIQTSSSMPLENKVVCRQGRVQGNYLSLEI